MLKLISNKYLHTRKSVFVSGTFFVSAVLSNRTVSMKRNILFLTLFILFLSQLKLFSQGWNSQKLDIPISTPEGDEVIGTVSLPTGGPYSSDYITYYLTKDGIFGKAPNGVLVPLPWTNYLSAEIKGFYVFNNKLFVSYLNEDGKPKLQVYTASTWNYISPGKNVNASQLNFTGQIQELKGDAVYAITNSLCYVTRDQFASWQVDTTGLNGAVINSFELDSAQTVYSATTKGLFKQTTSGTVWGKVTSFPLQSNLNKIFIDRSQRIYVSAGGNAYYSTDKGNTWTANNTGFTYSTINGFGEDSYKNIYVIIGNQVYKSAGGTSPWVRIDKPVSDMFLDSNPNSLTSPLNNVGGDSTLYLSTHYGLFKSTDQGTTWSPLNKGISAKNIFGFAKSGSRTFVSTNLGLSYIDQNSSNWTRTFPSSGYTTGNVIFADQSGNVYTLGAHVNISNFYSPSTVWKSSDNGNTWQPDTAGFGSFLKGGTTQYFVDENKVQHLMLTNNSVAMYSKSPSDTKWVADTSGLRKGFSSYPAAFTSDNHGFLYAAFVDYSKNPSPGILFKRSIAGGSWVVDTTGLHGHQVWNITADANGNLVAGTIDDGVYKKIGSSWTRITAPSGLSSDAAFVTAIDKFGTLYAGFSNYNWNTFSYAWHGVYKTANGGANWISAGLDSVAVRNLVIIDDTLYAVTYYKGIFKMPTLSPTDVRITNNSIPSSVELKQNYPNPFNPSTIIGYQLPSRSFVTLKVYNVLGQEVKTLVNEYQDAGHYAIQVSADNGQWASGIYFYKIQAGESIQIRKMVLVK